MKFKSNVTKFNFRKILTMHWKKNRPTLKFYFKSIFGIKNYWIFLSNLQFRSWEPVHICRSYGSFNFKYCRHFGLLKNLICAFYNKLQRSFNTVTIHFYYIPHWRKINVTTFSHLTPSWDLQGGWLEFRKMSSIFTVVHILDVCSLLIRIRRSEP